MYTLKTKSKALSINQRHILILNNFFKQDIIKMMATIIAIRNGVENGGDLFMTISENIYNINVSNGHNGEKNNIKIITFDSANKSYEEKIRPNGAWVYNLDEETGWVFERYTTIEEAIRRSIKIIGSIVLCEGKEVKYEALDRERAYYIDFDKEYKIVKL